MFIYFLDGDGIICRLVTYFTSPFFIMQAGTGIAELIALEISKKVSYTLVFICYVKLFLI